LRTRVKNRGAFFSFKLSGMAQDLKGIGPVDWRIFCMMRKNSGFTAFEVAVTLAILASVAAFVMPPYLKWLRDHRLTEATSTIMADIEMAKITAIRENAFVVVQFADNGYTIFVDNGVNDGDWNLDSDEEILRDRQFVGGVRINLAQTTFASYQTRFNGRGRIGNQGTLTLVNLEGTQKQVDMTNRFGRIMIN
jgi:prepilin-type N-terminal cleavage/methylation domain-containing protein